jgi:CTP:molybdopterin cytidylyltransferase MocA
MNQLKAAAVIPAAGLSSRMQAFKPLVKMGGKTIVEHVVEIFRSSGIDDIVVVAGHRFEELIPLVEAASCNCVVNHNFHDGMFSSIQRGVQELKDRCDAFFLLPVDIPLVRPDTIQHLLDEFFRNPSALICYPEFQLRRGHPPLIHGNLIDPILAYDGQDGMRGLLSRYEDRAVNVPVNDPFIRMDVDTPEDLFLLENYR